MIKIKDVKVGDLLRYPDKSGPVKVKQIWPFGIEVDLGIGYYWREEVTGDLETLRLFRDEADNLLYN